MKNIWNNIKKYPLLVFFAVLLYTISIADLFSPVETFSELENRKLATFPKFSWQQLFDNEYTIKIEDFTEDHFILRDKWISLKSISESVLGKKENNGVVYGKDGYMFTKFISADYNQLAKNMDNVSKFINNRPDLDIKFMLAPTAPGVMTDKVLEKSPVVDTRYILDYAQNNLPEGTFINVQPRLAEHTDEYIYYRTDHHWTTLGAYYAYEQFMQTIGRQAQPLDSFTFVDVENFLGTHYSKAKNYNVQPDVLSYIESDAQITINDVTDSIYDYSKLDVRDKYAMFLRGNPGYATIKGNGEGKVLIVKDSYANCFVPYLVNDFEQIDVIDLRYITMGLDRFIQENGYEHILFLYNCETILTDENLVKINLF